MKLTPSHFFESGRVEFLLSLLKQEIFLGNLQQWFFVSFKLKYICHTIILSNLIKLVRKSSLNYHFKQKTKKNS